MSEQDEKISSARWNFWIGHLLIAVSVGFFWGGAGLAVFAGAMGCFFVILALSFAFEKPKHEDDATTEGDG